MGIGITESTKGRIEAYHVTYAAREKHEESLRLLRHRPHVEHFRYSLRVCHQHTFIGHARHYIGDVGVEGTVGLDEAHTGGRCGYFLAE